MQSRRVFLMSPILLQPLQADAQAVKATFVGIWQGEVPGIGDARLIISAVKQNGQVEGRIEFIRRSTRQRFGNKADPTTNTNYGVVSGSTLSIETAIGGRYHLNLNGDQLSGVYVRGTTYRVAVSFKRS